MDPGAAKVTKNTTLSGYLTMEDKQGMKREVNIQVAVVFLFPNGMAWTYLNFSFLQAVILCAALFFVAK